MNSTVAIDLKDTIHLFLYSMGPFHFNLAIGSESYEAELIAFYESEFIASFCSTFKLSHLFHELGFFVLLKYERCSWLVDDSSGQISEVEYLFIYFLV